MPYMLDLGVNQDKILSLKENRDGYISGEKCAELLGMNAYEFYEWLRQIDIQEEDK